MVYERMVRMKYTKKKKASSWKRTAPLLELVLPLQPPDEVHVGNEQQPDPVGHGRHQDHQPPGQQGDRRGDERRRNKLGRAQRREYHEYDAERARHEAQRDASGARSVLK